MDRFNKDKSKQDIIDRLKEENEGLKRKIEKQDAGTKRINKKRRCWRICGIILMVTGLIFLGILIYEEGKEYKSAREIKSYRSKKKTFIVMKIHQGYCLNTVNYMKQILTWQDG